MFKNFFSHLNMLWTNFTDWLSIGFSVLLMIVGIAGIIGTIVVFLVILNKDKNEKSNTEESTNDKSTKKTRKTIESVLLVASSILCCIFMVPTIAGFNSYSLKSIKKNKIAELDREIENRQLKKEVIKNEQQLLKQQNKIEQQSIEVKALEDSLRLLKNTQLNVQNFKEILQVALLETDFKQISVYRDRLSEIEQNKFLGFGWEVEGHNYVEGLAIFTHAFTAKFGIDFKDLKINTQPYGDTIFISGIKPKFIGMANFSSSKELAELRKVDEKGGGKKYTILNDPNKKDAAEAYAEAAKLDYEEQLNKGIQTQFMDAAVVKLAKNFIKLILAPLGKKIEFIDRPDEHSVSLEKYLQNSLKEVEERLESIQNSSSQTTEELKTKKRLLEEANKKLQEAKAEQNKQESEVLNESQNDTENSTSTNDDAAVAPTDE